MELKQIQDLIKFVAKSGVEEVEIEKGNFKITIRSKSDKGDGHNQQAPQQFMVPAGMLGQQMMQNPQAMPQQQAQGQQQPAAQGQSGAQDKGGDDSTKETNSGTANLVEIKAPMIGTFYRSPGPEKDVFVKVGDEISAGKTVCIIEAMKLFNEIESDISGKIVKVLVDDAAPVEYDQPLFLVEPA